ncbi:MAG: HAMP domain-containing protein [Chloroflexi bacterium]|nr:HAMP domain-containing protein [Chloroflexota bacterium]
MPSEHKSRRNRHSHISLPRLPLLAQTYLWGLILVGIILIASSVAAWLLTHNQAYASMDGETTGVLDSFEAELAQDINTLILAGKWLASPSNSPVFDESLNKPEVARPLQTFLETAQVDLFMLADERGRVVAKMGSTGTKRLGDDISALPDFAEALAGATAVRTEVDASGQLAVKLALPRYARSDNGNLAAAAAAPAGVIIMGFLVDDDYLKDIRKKSRFDMGLVVISREQLAASKLTSRGPSPQMAQFGTGSVNLDDRILYADQLVTLMTHQGPYLYRFRALSAPARASAIVIGSGMPTTILETVHDTWLRTFGLVLLIGLADLLIVGLLMARNFSRSVKELSRATQELATGNLTSRIILWRDDELGDLAFHLDQLRKEFARKLEQLTLEKNGATGAIGAMAVPMLITDSQNRIVVVNHAAELLMGYSNADLEGRVWHSLFALPQGADWRDLPSWIPGQPIQDDHHPLTVRGRLALNAGAQPVLDISSVPIQIEGDLVGYALTLQDVSEIDRFAKAKNEFLLAVAHELEGPLASWRASVELLVEDYSEMTRNELGLMLRTLQRTAVRFQGLVEALVDIGKLEAGKFRVQPSAHLYDKLIKDSIGQIEPVLQGKGQNLEITYGTRPTCRVMADRARISQVVINLLRNASKYSPEGEPIIVATREEGERVFFEVTDRGFGIDPDEQEHIFERYYRSKRVEEEGAGIGLGLSLAKAIVEAHGGQIGVSSELGKGSTFWFSLTEIGDGESSDEPRGINESAGGGRR